MRLARPAPVFASLWLLALWLYSALAQAAGPLSLKVEQVVERTYDGAPALAVVLSDPLDGSKRHDSFFEVSRAGQVVSGGWVLGENGQVLYFPHVDPETDYVVLVRRGLTAKNGRALPGHQSFNVKTQPIMPMAGFASQGLILPAGLTDGLPVVSVNVPAVDVEFLRVPVEKMQELALQVANGGTLDRWYLNEVSQGLESVYLARFDTHGEPNRRTISHIPVGQIPQLAAPGFYLAVLNRPGSFEYNAQTAFFTVSDIGLHLRRFPQQLELFAASIATGAPLPDVEVALYDSTGKPLAQRIFTDVDGRATLPAQASASVLLGKHGQQLAFIGLAGPALDLSEFAISGRPQRPLEIYAYGPRDIYRPGETVDVTALLRDSDGRASAPLPLNARLIRADGKLAAEYVLPAGELGHYSHSFAIPSDAPTGRWQLELRVDPKSNTPDHLYSFLVEEFLPERMKLTLTTPAAALTAGQEALLDIQGDFLYGAPAAGARVTGDLLVRPARELLEQFPGYRFGNPDGIPRGQEQQLFDATLDEAGHYQQSFQPWEGDLTTPLTARIRTQLFEAGGRPVARSLEWSIWPADTLVGIRPLFDKDESDSETQVGFEVIRTNAAGELLAANDLEVALVRESRDYYWQFEPGSGWSRQYSELAYPVVRQNLSFPVGGRGQLTLPVEWGRYRLEILDPVTGLTTRYRFEAGWSWEDTEQGGARPDQVTLTLDRPAYKAGEVAKVQVVPPQGGHALITVEGDRVLWQRRLELPAEGATVEIPIDADWTRHDLYVTALVLRGAGAVDKATPARAVGLKHLPLERGERRLAVELTAPERMEPERPLAVDVAVPGAAGESAMVTIAAVDEGILALTDFQSPDPFDWFFAPRGYGADLFDLYHRVVEKMAGKTATLSYGGDGDIGGKKGSRKPDAEVKIVSLYSGPVTLDSQGRAHVELPVPDFNGQLRVMAVAFTADRFGAAERQVVVRAPVIAELSTPRFLGAGDHAVTTLDLHNLSGHEQNLTVTLRGVTPVGLPEQQRQIQLADGERRSLTFPISGAEAFGVGRLELAVSGEGIDIRRQWELAVRPPYPGLVRAVREPLAAGGQFVADPALLEGLLPATIEVELLVSPQPPLDLARLLKTLLHYPYGCAEQTTSGAFPLLFADSAAQNRFLLDPVADSQRREWIEGAVGRLAGKQHPNGAFSLWGGDGAGNPWLSAYVTDFLLEARDRGYAVPAPMLDKALEALANHLQNSFGFTVEEGDSSPAFAFASRAYAGYVLARAGRAPLGTLRTLYDQHQSEGGDGLSLVQLGLALKLGGDERRANEAIKAGIAREKGQKERYYGFYGDYGSQLRNLAAIIQLLDRYHVKSPELPWLISSLAERLRQRQWLSTQERNALFLAGLALSSEKAWQGTLTTGKRGEPLAVTGTFRRSLSPEALRQGVSFTSRQDSPLYLSLEVAGYPHAAPPTDGDDGITILRELYDTSGTPIGDRPLVVGELLLARTRVDVNQSMRDALLVDMLPAGLELENQNLAHAQALEGMQIPGLDLQAMANNQEIDHLEFRDDRFVVAADLHSWQPLELYYLLRVVTPGRYQWAMPFIEEMYRPERRAFGAAGRTIEVAPEVLQAAEQELQSAPPNPTPAAPATAPMPPAGAMPPPAPGLPYPYPPPFYR